MRAYALCIGLLGLLAGCSADWDPAAQERREIAQAKVAAPMLASSNMPTRSPAAVASLPDRGDLVVYDKTRRPVRKGAYTWHAVQLSEEHALRAVTGAELLVTGPNGQPIRLQYERHIEHPDGNWTWIGRVPGAKPGAEAILTFGEKAVFGSIPYGDEEPLRLTTTGGRAWLMQTDRAVIARLDNAVTRPRKPDFLLPPRIGKASTPGSQLFSAAQVAEAVTATATTTVNVLIGYTSGFATRLGGQSQATTRLTYLVDVTNQAYANSQIDARVRLVRAMQVTYPDNTSNQSALYALTGVSCTDQPNGSLDCEIVGSPASLQPLHTARDQHGADLVSLVRNFNDPENDGCGIAWLNGGGQSNITSDDEFSGMSVISDSNGTGPGSFPDNGFVCRDETLAHEMSHNMGSAHDRDTADGDDNVLQSGEYGRYPYSFGYKTAAGTGNFFTVMAYGDSGQTRYRVFSNPDITYCGGHACGVANQADNARSLRQTIPIVARFRDGGPRPDLFAVNRQGGSGTEVGIAIGDANYALLGLQSGTALGTTGTQATWVFRAGDFNVDGITDMFVIKKQGTTRTEVHVLDGQTQFATWLLHSGTPLGRTGGDEGWVFDLGDYNRDGRLDLYVIRRKGGTGQTEVHILDGRNQFKTYLLHSATALHQTGSTSGWKFAVGDYNRDGRPDVYVIKRNTSSGFAEVHVLNGANAYKSYLLHQGMPFRAPGTTNDWEFKVGDYNLDGILDLYAIKKRGSTSTELHIVDGADSYRTFLAHLATAIGITGSDWTWDFSLATQ